VNIGKVKILRVMARKSDTLEWALERAAFVFDNSKAGPQSVILEAELKN
jgi:hypothetical protein